MGTMNKELALGQRTGLLCRKMGFFFFNIWNVLFSWKNSFDLGTSCSSFSQTFCFSLMDCVSSTCRLHSYPVRSCTSCRRYRFLFSLCTLVLGMQAKVDSRTFWLACSCTACSFQLIKTKKSSNRLSMSG